MEAGSGEDGADLTTLCAIQPEAGGPIYIGSDRQLTCGQIIETQDFLKWRTGSDEKLGPWAFGASGEPALIDFLVECLESEIEADQDWPQGLARAVCERLRKKLDEIHWSSDQGGGQAPHRHSTVLAALEGSLWEMDIATGWALRVKAGEIVASGTGWELALGAAEALKNLEPWPRIMRALEVAIKYDTHSGGEPWVYCLG